MKRLNGAELAGYIKARQAKEVRRLKALRVHPVLAIISEGQQPVNELYLRLKQNYGRDIGVAVKTIDTGDTVDTKRAVLALNEDDSVQAVIVQLPLSNPDMTRETVNLIDPAKDVDGLGAEAAYDSATAMAIMWLLAGYNVDLPGKSVAVVGQGRLVGRPLVKMLVSAGVEPLILDQDTPDLAAKLQSAEIIITATGHPGLITNQMARPGTVIVDAGSASEDGQVKGDAANELYEREDIIITPQKGGVGPLTVAALFDNTLRAVRAKVGPS